ncbi:MAG: hypothetical protein OHK0029_27300 [Armatimonadaceae bacterium]
MGSLLRELQEKTPKDRFRPEALIGELQARHRVNPTDTVTRLAESLHDAEAVQRVLAARLLEKLRACKAFPSI